MALNGVFHSPVPSLLQPSPTPLRFGIHLLGGHDDGPPDVPHCQQMEHYGDPEKGEQVVFNCSTASMTTMLKLLGLDITPDRFMDDLSEFIRQTEAGEGNFVSRFLQESHILAPREQRRLARQLGLDDRVATEPLDDTLVKSIRKKDSSVFVGQRMYQDKPINLIRSSGLLAYLTLKGLKPLCFTLKGQSWKHLNTLLDQGKPVLILDQHHFPNGHYFLLAKSANTVWVSDPLQSEWKKLEDWKYPEHPSDRAMVGNYPAFDETTYAIVPTVSFKS